MGQEAVEKNGFGQFKRKRRSGYKEKTFLKFH